MPPTDVSIVSSFVEGAPPGELGDVVADIKTLTASNPKLLQSLGPAFESYNHAQYTTVKLPSSDAAVIVSPHNKHPSEPNRYYDVPTSSSFLFDHVSQKASSIEPYTLSSPHLDLIKSLHTALTHHAAEHYPTSTISVTPSATDPSTLALLLVSNRYSPNNFWNGRWRSLYLLPLMSSPSSPSSTAPPPTLTGSLHIDVHYYEDGNVRLTTTKPISVPLSSAVGPLSGGASGAAGAVIRQIAGIEKRYQEELNRAFGSLSEGAFKGLRRQLPVTRQKVEWERVGGYRLGQDIGGGAGSGGR